MVNVEFRIRSGKNAGFIKKYSALNHSCEYLKKQGAVFGIIFTVIYILTGIGVILGFINAVNQHRILNIEQLKKWREKNNSHRSIKI